MHRLFFAVLLFISASASVNARDLSMAGATDSSLTPVVASGAYARTSDFLTNRHGFSSNSFCASDSPCADAKAAWPIQPLIEDYEGFPQMSASFLMILPIGVLLLLAMVPGRRVGR